MDLVQHDRYSLYLDVWIHFFISVYNCIHPDIVYRRKHGTSYFSATAVNIDGERGNRFIEVSPTLYLEAKQLTLYSSPIFERRELNAGRE